MSEYEKKQEHSAEIEAIGVFLEWLEERYSICERMENEYQLFTRVGLSINQLIAQHFDIDLDKLEKERRATLDALLDQVEKEKFFDYTG